MADKNNDNTEEKTEKATERRLQQIREQGQVFRSRELNHCLCFLTGIVFFYWASGTILNTTLVVFQENFQLERAGLYQNDFVVYQLKSMFYHYAWLFFPFAFVLFSFLILTHWLVGGWVFSWNLLAPKLDRIDPIQGFQRIFSMKSLGELVKSILKVLLIGAFFVLFLFIFYSDGLRLFEIDTKQSILSAFHLLWLASVIFFIPMIIIAAMDIPFQLWQQAKNAMMSKFELKQEIKETEGKPEVKQKIRQLQQCLARARMMESIPKADVIITNPDHYAIALQYNKESMSAPILLAKGLDLVAEKIKSIAKEHEIPLVEAPPLARALYYGTDIGQQIPRGLYVAVAQVLAYVYQMDLYMRGRSQKPTLPKDWEIPPELRR